MNGVVEGRTVTVRGRRRGVGHAPESTRQGAKVVQGAADDGTFERARLAARPWSASS
ncbi:hypothetical protein [Nonomuraea jabiensis]|uniref:hypothetical protein n=1 Tax=Nonomuraea jabiensis TaxID=882448 RepID=UPI0036A8F6D5